MTGDAATLRSRLTRGTTPLAEQSSVGDRRGLSARGARRELLELYREQNQSSQSPSPFKSLRELAGTSPGRLFIIAAVLLIGGIGAGWYSATALDNRTSALRQTISDTEPIAESSQILYANLSIADASANAAFISGGLEPASLRERYASAIATASQALIQAAAGTTKENVVVRTDLNALAERLPVYTGLIESARTNNRLGNPVGSAYLGEASDLMQTTILPAAQRLYTARSSAISDPQNRFTNPPWGVYAALGVLLAALLGADFYVARRTNRKINLGLLLGSVAIVVALVWVLVGSLLSVSATKSAETQGARPLRELTSARILVQQARSVETLSIARRGDQDKLQQQFVDASRQVRAILEAYDRAAGNDSGPRDAQRPVQAAIGALNAWDDAHAATVERSDAGDYSGATALAVGNTPDGSARAYATLDTALTKAITATRTRFRDEINTARVVIGFAGSGVLALGVLAATASVVGLVPRIREYR
ncbi:hypothetical protein [Williamsia sp. CHRR-6]|uniref:hypothetical protein n=1 Tax=Williamsia sp. CHRR-6 TaxID=2835871 RepID=UPI001BD95802|nr:hypothetical protein [Williamsia sp. CHRR-6]MBT0567049.1 hypothetical protein [Williamsia sp. CHRR-6]